MSTPPGWYILSFRGNWTRSIRWKGIVSSSRLLIVSLSDLCIGGGSLHELEADVGEIEGLGDVQEVNSGVHNVSSVSIFAKSEV